METDIQSRLRLDRLKEAREKRGLSQRRLARVCGFSIHQIYRYENGMSDPSATSLAVIAEELNVSTDYLLGLSDAPQGQSAGDLTVTERRVVNAFKVGDSKTIVRLLSERIQQLEGEDGDSDSDGQPSGED